MQLLSAKQKKLLKGKAQKLQPYLNVGKNGMTTAVLRQLDKSLTDHELIKVKVAEEDREIFKTLVQTLADETEAQLLGILGRTAVLYRLNEEQNRFKIDWASI